METFSVGSRSVATAPRGAGAGQSVSTAPGSAASETAVATLVTTQTPTPERIAQAVKQVNDDFIQKGQNLYALYEKDKSTGINVVKVLDKNTQEVISQFPPKDIIAIAEGIDQFQAAKGRLIHVSA